MPITLRKPLTDLLLTDVERRLELRDDGTLELDFAHEDVTQLASTLRAVSLIFGKAADSVARLEV